MGWFRDKHDLLGVDDMLTREMARGRSSMLNGDVRFLAYLNSSRFESPDLMDKCRQVNVNRRVVVCVFGLMVCYWVYGRFVYFW